MKNLTLLFLIILCSCGGENNSEKEKADSIQKAIAGDTVRDSVLSPGYKYPPIVVVKDQHAYSQSFINGFKSSDTYNHFKLIDSLLIVDHKDTFLFPLPIPLHKKLHFSGCNNGQCFNLDVERMNYSSIEYKLRVTGNKFGGLEGTADLSFFFRASKVDEDETEAAYTWTEYYAEQPPRPYIAVQIGKNEKGIVAKVVTKRKSKYDYTSLDDCPILYLKTLPD